MSIRNDFCATDLTNKKVIFSKLGFIIKKKKKFSCNRQAKIFAPLRHSFFSKPAKNFPQKLGIWQNELRNEISLGYQFRRRRSPPPISCSAQSAMQSVCSLPPPPPLDDEDLSFWNFESDFSFLPDVPQVFLFELLEFRCGASELVLGQVGVASDSDEECIVGAYLRGGWRYLTGNSASILALNP